MKYWEVIADKLSKAGWSWGCVSSVDSADEQCSLLMRIAATVKDRHTGDQICSDKVLISREKVL